MTQSQRNRWMEVLRWPLLATLVLVVGFLDYHTGVELTFSFFYLLPVAVAAWWYRRKLGIIMSFICAFVSWAVDWLGGFQLYRHDYYAAWNALLRLAIFISFALILYGFRRKIAELERLARFDLYTGILNSRGFYEAAARRLKDARESGRPVALVYMDLDDFKSVNDTRGHLEGDRLLYLVAQTLKTRCTSQALIGRLGGDEFALLIDGDLPPDLERCLKQLRSDLNSRMQAEDWPVTFSLGVVSHGRAPDSLESMIRGADNLMYEVKNSGKNSMKIAIH